MIVRGGAACAGLGWGAWLLALTPASLAAAPRTLAETFAYAHAHAPQVSARAAEREEARAAAQSQGWWLPAPPEVAGDWSRTTLPGAAESRDRLLEASLEFEPLGQVVFRARAAGAQRDLQLATVDAQAREWAAAIAWSYYELVRWQWLHGRVGQRETTGQRLAEIVTRRFKAGDASQLEVDLAQVSAAESARQALVIELGLQQAQARLAAAIGWPSGEQALVADSVALVPSLPDTAGLAARAVHERPALRVARAALESDRAASRLATSRLLPEAELAAYGGTDTGDDIRGLRLGLTLPFLGPAVAERRARAAAWRRRQAEYDAAMVQAAAEIGAARAAAALSYRQVQLFQERVLPGLESSRSRFSKAYAIGEVDLTTVLLHEQRCREAEDAFAAALAEYTAALRDLEWATGLPLLSGDSLATEVEP